ncbi:MAG: hypothetical protein GY786_17865 [Proteobacteria bacterium]|nr:hypothetical protein [Pseudomonadota bacterium]
MQPSDLYAQEIKTFEAEITVEIRENDIAFARNNAFQLLKKEILSLALSDLISEVLLQEYQSTILNRGKISSNKYIRSVKILQEKSENSKFQMKLQGAVQMDTLREALAEQQLIFKDDPFKEITFVIGGGIQLPVEELTERLEQFHLRVGFIEEFDPVILENLKSEPRILEKELFLRFPGNNIILYAEMIASGTTDDLLKGVLFKIFRRNDYKLLGQIRWSLSEPVQPEFLEESLRKNLDKNLARFSLYSLKIGDYEGGKKEDYLLKVDGLNTPYKQYIFERRVLKTDRRIKSFRLSELSKIGSTYKIQAKAEFDEMKRIFEKENQYFDMTVLKEDYLEASINLSARWKKYERKTEMSDWEPDPAALTLIKEILSPDAEVLSFRWTPTLVEKEPNNRSHEFNLLPENSMITGRVSSRSDSDIYQLSSSDDRSVLVIDWVRFGKTALSPRLKLYDENFTLLGSYKLSKTQNRLRIHYPISLLPTHNKFIQISDELGFIRGETGGYKSYSYLLKYWWEKGINQIEQIPMWSKDQDQLPN